MDKKPLLINKYEFFSQLCKLPFVKAIYLFGSRARGDAEKRSDIDIAIDCPNATQDDWLSITQIIDNADTLLKIDCIRFDTLENQKLKNAIQTNHIVLYTRNKND